MQQPKPAGRVKDKAALARFAAVRTWCQVCGSERDLHIHHMADMESQNISRRSDVPDNLMRLCFTCHMVKFHDKHEWSKERLRELKEDDEKAHSIWYEDAEDQYDAEVIE